jgi:hypothetical protein
MLKEQIKALKDEFGGKSIEKVEEIFQGLIDAYLINIGQLELFLQENNYVEVPDVEEIKIEEPKEEKEAEDVKDEEEIEEVIETEEEAEVKETETPRDFEAFEYFVDFDEPEGEALTDKDLYNI